MFTRYFALGVGVAFIAAGIGGFVPLFTTNPPAGAPHLWISASYGLLLGLFPVNVLHNIFHILAGIAGVLAYRQASYARRYCQGFALVVGSLAIFGLLPGFQTLFGLMPLFGHDIWLHALEAIAAAYLGFAIPTGVPDQEASHVG